MRPAPTLLLVVLSALHFAAAFKARGHSKQHHKMNMNRVAQAKSSRNDHQPRALLDVCAYIDADLLNQQSILDIPLGALLDVDVCLCLSALPLYLETNVKASTLIDLLGLTDVSALLQALITSSPSSKECKYPSHAKPLCSAQDVCGFTCKSPFVRDGESCTCQSPNTECSGKCGFFPQGCPSIVPQVSREKSHPYGVRSLGSYPKAKRLCAIGEQLCGAYNSRAFECLDVQTNLESCGGCAIPNPFIPAEAQVRGVDCSSLPGVDDVTCSSGTCVILRCQSGWALSPRGDACRRVQFNSTLDLVVQEETTRRSTKRMSKVKKRQSEPATIIGILATSTRNALEAEAGIISSSDVGIGSGFGTLSLDDLDLVTGVTTDPILGANGVSTNTDLDSAISSDLLNRNSVIDVSTVVDDTLAVTTKSEDEIVADLELN